MRRPVRGEYSATLNLRRKRRVTCGAGAALEDLFNDLRFGMRTLRRKNRIHRHADVDAGARICIRAQHGDFQLYQRGAAARYSRQGTQKIKSYCDGRHERETKRRLAANSEIANQISRMAKRQ